MPAGINSILAEAILVKSTSIIALAVVLILELLHVLYHHFSIKPVAATCSVHSHFWIDELCHLSTTGFHWHMIIEYYNKSGSCQFLVTCLFNKSFV